MNNEYVGKVKTAMNRVINSYSANYEQAKTEYEKGRLVAHINFARFILDVIGEYEALEKYVAECNQNNDGFMIGWAIGKLEFSTVLMNTLNDIKK